MKNKEFLIRASILTLLFLSILWELILFSTSPKHWLAELPKQTFLSAMLFWVVSIICKQKQDDDDWAF